MRVVLDEGVPRALAKALAAAGIEVDPFDAAWSGLKNGALLRMVETAGYAVLVTTDKNMGFQQNLSGRAVAIVALPLNRRRDLIRRVDDVADTIRRALPGRHTLMSLDGSRASHRITDGENLVEALTPLATFKS